MMNTVFGIMSDYTNEVRCSKVRCFVMISQDYSYKAFQDELHITTDLEQFSKAMPT